LNKIPSVAKRSDQISPGFAVLNFETGDHDSSAFANRQKRPGSQIMMSSSRGI
jgi:hypothetical protein